MATQFYVGLITQFNEFEFEVESIIKRDMTTKIHFSSDFAREMHKKHCISHITLQFVCDDFEQDDIVTERVEEIRMRNTENSSPFIIRTYHLFTKENKPNVNTDSSTEESSTIIKDGSGGIGSEPSLRTEITSSSD